VGFLKKSAFADRSNHAVVSGERDREDLFANTIREDYLGKSVTFPQKRISICNFFNHPLKKFIENDPISPVSKGRCNPVPKGKSFPRCLKLLNIFYENRPSIRDAPQASHIGNDLCVVVSPKETDKEGKRDRK
jgi:hypothetical protein